MITRACDVCEKLLRFKRHTRVMVVASHGGDEPTRHADEESIDVCDECLKSAEFPKWLVEKVRFVSGRTK